jgi:hypothetical protein
MIKNYYITLAFGNGIFFKALITSIIVGTILTLINHGDKIIDGQNPSLWKISLTYCVPFCVTIWGAINGKLSKN